MTFDPHKPKYYSDVADVFSDVRISPRLSGVEATFGKISGQAMGSLPRIRWELGKDRFKPAELVEQAAIYQDDDGANRLVHIEEFQRRDAGVTVYLFAATHQALNGLVIRFVGALADVLRATAVYEIGDGEEIEPSDDATQSWCYRLQITIRLFCADTLPASYPLQTQAEI